MSTLVDDDMWFCQCCLFAHANGDTCDCGNNHEAEVTAGFERLSEDGKYHVAMNSGATDEDPDNSDGEMEFSWRPCECCESRLGGSRHRFALFET